MPNGGSCTFRKGGLGRAFRLACLLLATASPWGRPLLATSVIPISDAELYQRADVIVHGIVLSSDVTVDDRGRPETLIFIEPLAVLKGQVSGSLVLHQAGGTLPDGRFFKLWGRPEYVPGREVVVFAIARAKGEYETAEMLLGKFEVWQDEAGNRFAVPDLAIGHHPGVEVREARPETLALDGDAPDAPGLAGGPAVQKSQDNRLPRRLSPFLASLAAGSFDENVDGPPAGKFEPVAHEQDRSGRLIPQWGTLGNSFYRWDWSKNPEAVWTLSGTANITGGGVGEANGAVATWANDPNSSINYTVGSGSQNIIYLDAVTSTLGCGWSSCLTGAGGVIGCAGPTGLSGGNTLRGETYSTIVKGTMELRSYCTMNVWSSVTTQSVITHELGHTLGLGHSDQDVSPHDVCRGDESAAVMRSMVQNYTTLKSDDQDAIRWLYGDGGNSCGAGGVAPTAVTSAASGIAQAAATLNGTVNPNGVSTTSNFQYGTTSSYGLATGQQGIGSGTSASPVTAVLSGLACGTLYHFRAVGTNANGTGNGSDMTFSTSACAPPPLATTNPASGVGQSGATFAGSVNPNGMSTTAYFQYGTTTSYGSTTAPQSVGSGTSSVTVNQVVAGLMCNTLYHFRVVATSPSGTSTGSDRTFTTGACTASGFYTLTPCRIVDTRSATGPLGGPALAAGTDRVFAVTGQCGIPATARSLSVNVTVTQGTAGGDLRIHAAGSSCPLTSSINFRAGQTRANNATIPLGTGGGFSVDSDQASGTVQAVFDVNGYFQ